MKNQLIPLNQAPAAIERERGLSTVSTFQASSGFLYHIGERDCGSFTIQEGVARGTGIEILCSIRIFSGGELLAERTFEQLTPYTRDRVRATAGHMLIQAFTDALRREAGQHNLQVDMRKVQQKVDAVLDRAYYHKSDQAALGLLREWGML